MTAVTHDQTWDLLEHAIGRIRYTRDERPTTPRFQLVRDDDSNYAVLYVFTHNPNTYRPDEIRHTRHEFVVPVATYHEDAWIRWVFDRIASIEQHETCESFQVDGVRIYAPHHGNGEDPYAFWPGGTAEQKAKAPGEN
jgi:hypothetical protein